MKRVFGVLVLAVIGFYGVWPAWTVWSLKSALEAGNAAGLDANVDFPSVRESLKPRVAADLSARLDVEINKMGPGAPGAQAIAKALKERMLPGLVDQALVALVTPDNAIRLAREGGDMKKTIEGVLNDAAGQIGAVTGAPSAGSDPSRGQSGGGLGGIIGGVLDAVGARPSSKPQLPAPAAPSAPSPTVATVPPPTAAAAKASFGFGNIKSFAFAGPLSFDIGIARDGKQVQPDAIVGLSFGGGGWKLSRVVPTL